jgi:hypothetical protein
LAIGRLVLVHQSDPVALIREAAGLVRRGGVVAFHEPALRETVVSFPRVPLIESTASLLNRIFQHALPHHDASDRLIQHFSSAGLPVPRLFSEVLVGGGADSPLYAWLADTVQSIAPRLAQLGIDVIEAVGPMETLTARLRDAAVEVRSQLRLPAQVCAWTRI